MNEAAELDECRDEVRGGKFPSRLRGRNSNGGGGGMEGVLKRLDAVESTVLEIKSQVDGITAILPQLATKDDVTGVRVEVSDVRGEVGKIVAITTYLATKADLSAAVGGVQTDLSTAVGGLKADLSEQVGSLRADLTEKLGLLENRLVKWTIGIIIAVAGLAFTIGKYGH
jgi:hypothetical protein